jgi:hypothetical protein
MGRWKPDALRFSELHRRGQTRDQSMIAQLAIGVGWLALGERYLKRRLIRMDRPTLHMMQSHPQLAFVIGTAIVLPFVPLLELARMIRIIRKGE